MLKTKRLIIRPYKKEDEELVYKVINNHGIYESTLHIPYPYPREQVSVWIHFTLKNSLYKRGYEWGIFDTDGNYIGNVGIVNVDRINSSAEITYFIGECYWGQGYATEAVKSMLEFAFQEIKLERVKGRCMVENLASLKVMYKCGFSYEGRARHEVIKEGEFRDVWHAGILKEDDLEKIKEQQWPRYLFSTNENH